MAGREGYHRTKAAWQPNDTQRRILDGIAEGLTNGDIADRLDISPNTVKWHISQLLAETGLRDRSDLVARWKPAEEEETAVVPLLPGLLGRLLVSPLGVAAALSVVAVVGVVTLAGGASGGTPPPLPVATPSTEGADARGVAAARPTVDPGQAARTARLETVVVIRARQTNAAAGQPTPVQPLRRVWIFDVKNKKVQPLGFLPPGDSERFAFVKWLEDGKTLFGQWTDGYAVVRTNGKADASFEEERPGAEPGVGLAIAAVPRSQNLLFWHADSETLSLYDLKSKTEKSLLPLPGARTLTVSPDGSLLAYTLHREESLDLHVLKLTDQQDQKVASIDGAGAIGCCIEWSPDNKALLLLAGTADYVESSPGSGFLVRKNASWQQILAIDVVSGAKTPLPYSNQQPTVSTAHWAGPGKVVLTDQTAGIYGAKARVQDLATGNVSSTVSLDGLVLCYSPSGRYFINVDGSALVVRDAQTKEPVLRAITGSPTGHCDWTKDETKVVMSFLWGYPY